MTTYTVRQNGSGFGVYRRAHVGTPHEVETCVAWRPTPAAAEREMRIKISWEHIVAADAGHPPPDVRESN
jgi:hypothetical protein